MGERILIVDDQPGILLLLRDILENDGYQVETAETGQEALEAIQTHIFDLIILDYRLPVVNGIEVVQELEKEQNATPVIIMSGLTETITKETEQYQQIVAMLAKPFDIAGVSDLVKESIARYH